jgi:hypothetical protein
MTSQIPEVVHPTRRDALTPLERELWRLRMVALEAQVMLRGYNSVTDVATAVPDGLLFSLANHALLIVAKFLEVWSDFGRLAKLDERVINARKAVAPLVRRVNVWTGLEDFRNTTLAHPYTDRSGRLVGPWFLMETHRVPTYHAEILVLLNCLMFAVAGTLAAFFDEYRALGPSFRSGRPIPDSGPGIELGTEIDSSVKSLLVDVDQSLQRLGVPAKNPVFAEFRNSIQPSSDEFIPPRMPANDR